MEEFEWDDEDERIPEDKFDECYICKNKYKPNICLECFLGEYFEEEDIDEVDKYFK